MGGTNAMLASIHTKLNQVEARHAKFEQQLNRPTGNASTKPRAPWRPKAEYIKLMQEGRCTRCTKNGHLGPDCPSFRAYNRFESRANIANIKGVNAIFEPENEIP